MDKEKFSKEGYDIIEADNIDVLVEMREKIFNKAKELVDYKGESVEDFFNNFHEYALQGPELNEKRMALIRYCQENLNIGKDIFNAFQKTILELIGPDILVQKSTNLVIQQPDDPGVVPTHRDAPPNSKFEVVVWVPFVEIFGTKGMYIFNHEKTNEALELLKDPKDGYELYKQHGEKEGTLLKMSFGHALFFWTGLIHGCFRNKEESTRWSLNIRYKNIFSPAGEKGNTEFFEILQMSPLTRNAFEHEYEKGMAS